MANLTGNLALLEASGLADFDALFAAAERGRVDGHRWRSASRLELRDAGGGTVVVYVKRQWGRAARRPWGDLLRLRWPAQPARREWENARRLQAAGIPVAEPVAFGYSTTSDEPRSILVFREVRGRSLAAYVLDLAAVAPRVRQAVARAVGEAVRRVHDAGLSFPDLYAKHVYLEGLDEGATPRVVLIAPQRLRRRTASRAAADLAALLATTVGPDVTRTDRLRVLRAYLGTDRAAQARRLIRTVERRAARVAGRGRDPNLLAERRTAPRGMVPLADERMTDLDGGRLRVNEAFRPALEAAGLATLEALMNFRGGLAYRDVPGRLTVRVELPEVGGRRQVVYLKRYTRVDGRTALRRTISLGEPVSQATAEARNIVRLSDLGIPTMRIVAIGEVLTHGGRREQSCLVTEEVADAVQADQYCEQTFGPGPQGREATAAKRRLIRDLADLARRLHGAGFTHRDFYLCHFLVRSVASGGDPVLHLIDLQRVRRDAVGRGERWIVKDLGALLFSSIPSPATFVRSAVFTRTDRMRFARAYFQMRHLDPKAKRLVRRAVAKAGTMAGREARRQARRRGGDA